MFWLCCVYVLAMLCVCWLCCVYVLAMLCYVLAMLCICFGYVVLCFAYVMYTFWLCFVYVLAMLCICFAVLCIFRIFIPQLAFGFGSEHVTMTRKLAPNGTGKIGKAIFK